MACSAFATVLWAGTVNLTCIYANQVQGKVTHSEPELRCTEVAGNRLAVQPRHLDVVFQPHAMTGLLVHQDWGSRDLRVSELCLQALPLPQQQLVSSACRQAQGPAYSQS